MAIHGSPDPDYSVCAHGLRGPLARFGGAAPEHDDLDRSRRRRTPPRRHPGIAARVIRPRPERPVRPRKPLCRRALITKASADNGAVPEDEGAGALQALVQLHAAVELGTLELAGGGFNSFRNV